MTQLVTADAVQKLKAQLPPLSLMDKLSITLPANQFALLLETLEMLWKERGGRDETHNL
jgi:hypothetical protein